MAPMGSWELISGEIFFCENEVRTGAMTWQDIAYHP
jgi:hypothetical protein